MGEFMRSVDKIKHDLNQTTKAISDFESLPDSALVKAQQICALLSCCRRTLGRHMARGAFPAPTRQAPNVIRWRAGEVRRYLKQVAA